jgi:hypothetical protein
MIRTKAIREIDASLHRSTWDAVTMRFKAAPTKVHGLWAKANRAIRPWSVPLSVFAVKSISGKTQRQRNAIQLQIGNLMLLTHSRFSKQAITRLQRARTQQVQGAQSKVQTVTDINALRLVPCYRDSRMLLLPLQGPMPPAPAEESLPPLPQPSRAGTGDPAESVPGPDLRQPPD